MTTTMTARDKTLLYFVALGTFLFIFVRFMFFPALESHAEAVDALAKNEGLREDVENNLLLAPAAAQEKTNAYEDLNNNDANFYSGLKSDQLDALVTGLELNHNLIPVTLNIGEPVPQALTGYIASSRAGATVGPSAAADTATGDAAADATADGTATDTTATDATAQQVSTLSDMQALLPGVNWASAYEQAGFFSTVDISFSADGERGDFLALLNDLNDNYPSLLLQSFTITDKQTATAEGDVLTTSTFAAKLTVILCDKEGVPAL